jgi:hypothetical protein
MKVPSPYRNLVISPVGDKSKHATWLAGAEERRYDLFLIYFGENSEYDFSGAEFTLRRKGFKFPLLDYVLKEYAATIANYDRIWCPDDDIAADLATINRLFDLFAKHRLHLAQPAISAGDVSYESLRQVTGTLLRYSPYVEVMCPIFSYEALCKAKPLFLETQSGWGIDWVWSKWFEKGEVAILDACGVQHTGVLMKGDLYQKLMARGIDPYAEFDECVAKYGGINRRTHKRMVRGTMPLWRIPSDGARLSLWERATKSMRWAA